MPILLAVSPLAAMRSAPTITSWTPPSFITWAAMLSQMSVTAMPLLQLPGGQPRPLQQRPGLVGEDWKRSALLGGGENTARAVPYSAVARPPALQCVSTPCRRRSDAAPPRRWPGTCGDLSSSMAQGFCQEQARQFRGRDFSGSSSTRRSMRSRAQNRLTAVGRLVRK